MCVNWSSFNNSRRWKPSKRIFFGPCLRQAGEDFLPASPGYRIPFQPSFSSRICSWKYSILLSFSSTKWMKFYVLFPKIHLLLFFCVKREPSTSLPNRMPCIRSQLSCYKPFRSCIYFCIILSFYNYLLFVDSPSIFLRLSSLFAMEAAALGDYVSVKATMF